MSLSLTKSRELFPAPWDGDQPAPTLTEHALELLEYVRDIGNLGQHYSRNRAAPALGLTPQTVSWAEREIRASIYAGQFRPKKRRRMPRSTRTRVYNRDGWACVLCGERNHDLLSLGHYPIPYSRGGTDHHTNLRTECRDCNHELGDTEGNDA